MSRRSNNLFSLLGGAAAGAIAMYLLDPEQGPRRREHLAEATGGALGTAGEALGGAWENVSEHVKTLGASVAAGASVAGEHASDAARDFSRSNTARHAQRAVGDAGAYLSTLGHQLLERARGLGQRLSAGAGNVGEGIADSTRDAADWSRDTAGSARQAVASFIGGDARDRDDDSHLIAHTVGTAAILAFGAGAMYFLDPERGRTRRAWAGQKVGRIVNDTGRAFRRAGQQCNDLLNRTRGTAHHLRDSVGGGGSGGPVSAEQLLQRVRSQMGHVVSRADQIQVLTDADGNVELTGRVAASELDGLLTSVRRVSGVSQITNRLEVLDRADEWTTGATTVSRL